MLTMTDPAGARLADFLSKVADGSVVRIVRGKHRFKLEMDRPRKSDETFAHDGRIVLALDERVATSLSSRQLQIRETKAGPRLRLQPQ